MDRYLFLDIDGVLNSGSYWEQNESCNCDTVDRYGALFDPVAVESLRYVIGKTGARIVISSTWRESGLAFLREMWKSRSLPGEILDITDDGKAPGWQPGQRGMEIECWLKDNAHGEYRYAIIDDISDFLEHQFPHFIQIDGYQGMTMDDALMAVMVLIG